MINQSVFKHILNSYASIGPDCANPDLAWHSDFDFGFIFVVRTPHCSEKAGVSVHQRLDLQGLTTTG